MSTDLKLMKFGKPKAILAAGMCAAVLLADVVGLYAQETSFWSSRRAAAQRMRGMDDAPVRSNGETAKLLSALPSVGAVALQPNFNPGKGSLAKPEPFTFGPRAGDWLGKLVSPFGTVNDSYLSPKKDAPFIVHIQDAHGIEEAQRNISSMIALLGQEPGINLVGVEGAWGSFSLEPYRDFPDPAMTKDIAEFLLKKGLIAGPEYAGLTMPKSPAFFGVENSDLYNANVKALKSAFKDKEAAMAWVVALQSHTEKLKVSDYSETLKTFDRHFSGYQSEKVKLADYVRYLTTTLTQIKPRPATPQMHLLMEALNQEEGLNFKQVEAERKQMVEKLVDKLSKAQIQDLVNKSIDYRAGRVGYAEFHAQLKQTCQDQGISMKAYPQLGRYITYVLTADKIDRHALLNELDTVERTLPEALAKTPKEKELVAISYDLSLLHKLVRHEMSPTDWSHYQARGESVHAIPRRLEALGGPHSSEFTLTAFEDFCRYAAERNTALTGNLAQQMRDTKTNSSILIAGGFHTEGLSALLRQRQISYVVVTPKITAIPKDNNYLDVLARDPVPLEQLLAGDRISLAKPLAMADPHSSAALLISAIENLLGNQKTIVPLDDKSSLTTDPDRQGRLLFSVQGRPVYFTSSHPANHPFIAWLSSLASIVTGALPEKTELEGSFFIVRDVGNGELEKGVKEVVGPKGSDERYQLSTEDREIAAALTVEYTDEIRESVAQKFNQKDLIPPFTVSGRVITTQKIQGKSFHEILKGPRDLLDADWLENAREQCHKAINAANEALSLSYDGSGTLENGWRIQVDTNLENFLFDDEGRLIAWIDPIATWPPENRKLLELLIGGAEPPAVPRSFNSFQSIHERLRSIRNRSFWQEFVYGMTHPVWGGTLLETIGIFFGMKWVSVAFSNLNIHDPAWIASALQSVGMVDPTGSVFLTSIFVAAVFSLIHPDLWGDLSQGWKRIREAAQRKTNSKGDVARIFLEVSKTFLGTFSQRFIGGLVFISAIQLPLLWPSNSNTFLKLSIGMSLSYSIHSVVNAAILSSLKNDNHFTRHFPKVANILRQLRLFSTTIDVNSFILLVLKQLKNENYIKNIHQELMATFPGYKNEFLREFKESQVNSSTIAAFWTINSRLTIGEPSDNWKSLKSDLEATGKFEHIDDAPIGRGGFGEVRVCRSNNKEFLIKSVRFEKGTTLLNAIIAIASILIEGDILGKIKDHFRKGEVQHVAPILFGKAMVNGRNIIFQERIPGKNGNSVEMGKDALSKVERILDSLVQLHKIGVVHGDIKPENIILTKEGVAIFIDFGASKLSGQGFLMTDVISTNLYGTTASDFLTGATKSSDVYQMALSLFAFLPPDILTRPDIFPYIKRTISGFPLPDDGVPLGLDKLMYRPSSEELHDAIVSAIAHPMEPLSAIEQNGLFNEIRELRFSNSRKGNLARSKAIALGGNNIFYYFLRLFLAERTATKWAMRLLPLEISGLGAAAWWATGWAHTVLGGAMALDPTLMGVFLMAGGIVAFRAAHFALDKIWAYLHPGQGPPMNRFWADTARILPYALLTVLVANPLYFTIAFSIMAYDHFAFDAKRLLGRDFPFSTITNSLTMTLASATVAVVIAPIVLANLTFPYGAFFLVSLATQAMDPTTLNLFSENPATGAVTLLLGTISGFSTYVFSLGWPAMVAVGAVGGIVTAGISGKMSALFAGTKKWLGAMAIAIGVAMNPANATLQRVQEPVVATQGLPNSQPNLDMLAMRATLKSLMDQIPTGSVLTGLIGPKLNVPGYHASADFSGVPRGEIQQAIAILHQTGTEAIPGTKERAVSRFAEEVAALEAGTRITVGVVGYGTEAMTEDHEKTALAAVRGLLKANQPVLLLSDNPKGILKLLDVTDGEALGIRVVEAHSGISMKEVAERYGKNEIPLSDIVLASEGAVDVSGTKFRLTTFQSIAVSVRKAIDQLIAVLQAA